MPRPPHHNAIARSATAAPIRIARELDDFLARENIARAADLVGTLKFN